MIHRNLLRYWKLGIICCIDIKKSVRQRAKAFKSQNLPPGILQIESWLAGGPRFQHHIWRFTNARARHRPWHFKDSYLGTVKSYFGIVWEQSTTNFSEFYLFPLIKFRNYIMNKENINSLNFSLITNYERKSVNRTEWEEQTEMRGRKLVINCFQICQ